MSFETPAVLWGLLSLLLLAIFSLWRQAAQAVTVPSLKLWRQIPERNPPVRDLRRPQWRFELLLQAAAVALIVAALAGPFWNSDEVPPRRVAFVADTSPRMEAGGRLSRLLEEARRFASGPDRVTWYAAGARVEDPGAIRISKQRVDLTAMIAAARAGADETVVLTDRPVDGAAAWCAAGPPANAGIAAFRVDDEGLFARIVNFGPEREAELQIEAGGAPLRERLKLQRGSTVWSLKRDLTRVAELKVRLDLDDGWAADNIVTARRQAGGELAASVSGRHHPALVRVLEAVPGTRVGRGLRGARLAVGLDEAPDAGALRVWIHSPLERLKGALKLESHALLRGLPGRETELEAAGWGELPPALRTGTTLLSVGGRGAAALRGGDLHLSVDLDAWSRSAPSFPIFWANVAEGLRGELWVVDGLLDERESDAAGVERPWRAAAGAGAARERVRRPLAGWAALAALLCLAGAWGLQRRPG